PLILHWHPTLPTGTITTLAVGTAVGCAMDNGNVSHAPEPHMSDVTRILTAIEQGDPHAGAQLLPLVYEELRKLAAQKLAHEKPGQTLEATALVHEAFVRLVGEEASSATPW